MNGQPKFFPNFMKMLKLLLLYTQAAWQGQSSLCDSVYVCPWFTELCSFNARTMCTNVWVKNCLSGNMAVFSIRKLQSKQNLLPIPWSRCKSWNKTVKSRLKWLLLVLKDYWLIKLSFIFLVWYYQLLVLCPKFRKKNLLFLK